MLFDFDGDLYITDYLNFTDKTIEINMLRDYAVIHITILQQITL